MKTNTTLSGAMYLGPCWVEFEDASGRIAPRKLYAYFVRGERRFAASESDARQAVENGSAR